MRAEPDYSKVKVFHRMKDGRLLDNIADANVQPEDLPETFVRLAAEMMYSTPERISDLKAE